MLTKLLIICRYTFVEIYKSKVLINVFLVGLALLLICYVAYSFTYAVPERIALDVGLGMLSLSSVGLAIFFGVGLISKEIENRTIYMILSRPISRRIFFLGRILGMIGILILNISILSTLTILTYVVLGGVLNKLIFIAIIFSIIESIIILLIAVLFSLITNITLSTIYTIVIFISGHALTDTLTNRFATSNVFFNSLLKTGSYIFPNLSKLNLKDYVLYNQMLPIPTLAWMFSYGVLYSIFLIVIIVVIFDRKNLD
ncbi:MAG: hypothetical protein HQK49_10425 [Oligoflexia bacterium]|nr:hypothetical protein [Oligoflexia bacterium]